MADTYYYPRSKEEAAERSSSGYNWYHTDWVTGNRWYIGPGAGEVEVERIGNQAPTIGDGKPRTSRQPDELEFGSISTDDTIVPPPPGDYPIYRLMDDQPTLSLVEGIIMGQVMSGSVGVKAREGTPDKMVKFYQAAMMPLVKPFIPENLRALSLMWQPYELIWGMKSLDGVPGGPQQVIVDTKPLVQEFTTPLVNKAGDLVGLRNTGVTAETKEIWGANAYAYGWDTEAKRIIGRSRHENCRATAWWGWIIAHEESMRLDRKASGRVFSVAGPPNDAAGTKAVGRALASGKTAYMTNYLLGQNQRNVDPTALKILNQLTGYFIQQWDLGNYAASQDSMINKLRYYDANLFRAWKRPERSGIEGQRGTLAEAQEHGGVAMTDSDFIHHHILQSLSKGPGNMMLMNKFGPEAKDAVWLDPGPLTALNAQTDMMVLDAALADPLIRGQLMEQFDLDAIVERRNIPKLKTVLKIVIEKMVPPEQRETGLPPKPGSNGNGSPKKEATSSRT